MSSQIIRHAGRFNGSKEAFDAFCEHCKFHHNVDIAIDNQHKDDYWYSFEAEAVNGLTAYGITIGKEQAFFERRDVMIKEIELFSKQQSTQL